jgi:hypothetical protein
MANTVRGITQVQYFRRPYHQVDPVPNLLALYALSIKPFGSNEVQQQRFVSRPPPQDFIWQGTTTRGIPLPAVQAAFFRPPTQVEYYRRPYRQIPQESALTLKLGVAGPAPFIPSYQPEVYRRTDRDFLQMETLSYLPGPVIAPYIPVDFPTPMRARATPQDFLFPSTGIAPPKPFAQLDWPLNLPVRQTRMHFEITGATTRGIPTGINAPFSQKEWPQTTRPKETFHEIPPNTTLKGLPQAFPFFQDEWPLPLRAREFPAESYQSPQILLTTAVLRPFAQTDWPPLPIRRPTFPSADFGWEAWNTLYRPLPPIGGLIMPNLIGDNIYEAMKLLQQAGIYVPNTNYFNQVSSIRIQWGHSDQYLGGTVIAQSIQGGNLTSKGAPLLLTIASFPFASFFDLPPDWKQ